MPITHRASTELGIQMNQPGGVHSHDIHSFVMGFRVHRTHPGRSTDSSSAAHTTVEAGEPEHK